MIAGASKAVTVTPSDTVAITGLTVKQLHVGGAGIVQAVINGVTVPFTMPAGGKIDAAVQRVNATSTTATLIVALGD